MFIETFIQGVLLAIQKPVLSECLMGAETMTAIVS
jgi:hypothetical protein